MKLGIITSAALTLGVSLFATGSVKADRFADSRACPPTGPIVIHSDHGFYHDRYDRPRDFDQWVDVRDLPRCVLSTADRYGNGRYIVRARYVRRDGRTFYSVYMDRHNKEDINLYITPDGRLLEIVR